MYDLPGTGTFLVLAVICGVVGWGVIEFILWLFSFVHISFGA
ncbi:hypothetical protein M977_04428 [Buttiauxella gaviniae ATCC 51604]|uniref:Uncharacterized protein n=1 Tax=Buttiauxella gaviniae ATCC 51604 TaxID=1354253 RepID=A0A1B7HMC5_9ENTR|nr:hypothetical protein M977_04428 [Buttiauxella gaviniae ATCC 51604]